MASCLVRRRLKEPWLQGALAAELASGVAGLLSSS
eukprot:CAMPEP_0204488448 /NCGR_PEP_ID=MMETSP0471-20130131/69715_1 /ASSEMBLY_ACC=CAM_ASM_000602 /TAXON_ID=2969 /ORGANISM="Oxyrrhis marina" /LENGTH=34 /DNA_ID= /DNA_START= /DNA_END= /DNA_ORIENTATION=